jgi:hypothetical protein
MEDATSKAGSIGPACSREGGEDGVALAPGLAVRRTDGGTRVEWRIEGFLSKLQGSNGRPLVSPPFSVCGLQSLRLMIFIDALKKMPQKSAAAKRNSAKKGHPLAAAGPLNGALKLKADCLVNSTVLTFNLGVGAVCKGPFRNDFAEQAVRGPEDFGVDWLAQAEAASGGLVVSVEILEVL